MRAMVVTVGVLGWEPIRARYGPQIATLVVIAGVVVVTSPILLPVALVTTGAARLVTGYRERLHRKERAVRDVAVFARGLFVAVNAGLSLHAALTLASDGLDTQVVSEVRTLARVARRDGLALALAEASGTCSRLFLVLARAQTTGASIGEAVGGFVEEQREAHRLKVTEAARRLPVKLTVPLALLILPGFVVLTVGPSVLESARRLLGPVIPVP